MKKNIWQYMMIGAALSVAACTDLEVEETDSIVTESDGVFQGVNVDNTLITLYNDVAQSTQENLYALSVATTDELFIPTRGTDWGDNGVWRDLAKHSWTPSHLFNMRTWNYLNQNVYRANQVLNEKSTQGRTPERLAEAKFLRAYFMFWVLDLYRQVPFREADQGPTVLPEVMTPEEAYAFILKDLEEARDGLPSVAAAPGAAADAFVSHRVASKEAANFLLAKLYLNKHIYLGQAAPADAELELVKTAVEAIEASGYALEDDYFGIFAPSGDSETIFWANAEYASRIWGSLHYNQGRDTDWQFGGWNGFATTSEFYSKFEGPADQNPEGGPQEERRGYVPEDGLGIGFLIGTQYGPDGPIKARSGDNLAYTKDLPALTGNPDYTGIRLLKYHPVINMPGTWARHLVVMRYADAFLMKAEAMLRLGETGEALNLVNQLRALREATPLNSLDLDQLLDERGRELYIEGWRRNDLVRFGKFNSEFGFVENTSVEYNVFPIPDVALGSNPNLVQNPGY